MPPIRVLYIAAFQFSGTTLLSFLLNDHDEITTVGHMTGWREATPDFPCSCGAPLAKCEFYSAMRQAFEDEGLGFDPTDFGTAYSIAGNSRLNRLLTGGLPLLDSTRAELARDALVRALPPLRRRTDRIDHANRLFISTALRLNRARVFVDNSHSPYRYRQLSRVPGLDVRGIHLVRDPRGTVLSAMTNMGWTIETATRLWLRHHARIRRIMGAGERMLTVHYEDICRDADAALPPIHTHAGLEPQVFSGDFKRRSHHVLGNKMRLGEGVITLDERWRRDLAPEQIAYIEDQTRRAARRRAEFAQVVERYFG